MRKMSFETWRERVEKQFRKYCAMSIEDAGIDDEELRGIYADGWTPSFYVRWFARKYDLNWYTPGKGWKYDWKFSDL